VYPSRRLICNEPDTVMFATKSICIVPKAVFLKGKIAGRRANGFMFDTNVRALRQSSQARRFPAFAAYVGSVWFPTENVLEGSTK